MKVLTIIALGAATISALAVPETTVTKRTPGTDVQAMNSNLAAAVKNTRSLIEAHGNGNVNSAPAAAVIPRALTDPTRISKRGQACGGCKSNHEPTPASPRTRY
jgi:hypothetical protein